MCSKIQYYTYIYSYLAIGMSALGDTDGKTAYRNVFMLSSYAFSYHTHTLYKKHVHQFPVVYTV